VKFLHESYLDNFEKRDLINNHKKAFVKYFAEKPNGEVPEERNYFPSRCTQREVRTIKIKSSYISTNKHQ